MLAATQKMRACGEEPATVYLPEATFRLLRDKAPMKGNAKRRKAIRWRNRRRKHIRDYVSESVLDY